MPGRWITSPRSPGWLACRALVVLATMSASWLGAQDAVTPSAGGTNGNPYTIGCSTKAMVGVQGRRGGTIGQVAVIQAMCVDVNTDGTWIGTPAPAPGIAGTNNSGNPLVVLMCPRDQAVSGISGSSGMYVDALEIWCTPLGEYGRLNGSPELAPGLASGDKRLGVGGGGIVAFDEVFGPSFCPDNKPGKGFTGRAADWVDRVALVCNYPSVPPASVKTMSASPTSVVGGSPVNGTVTLNATAPSNGTQVTLSVNSALGSFQANPITVPAGQKVASFVLSTNAVPSARVATITASPNSGSPAPSAALSLQPPSLQALSLSSPKTSPGVAVTGTISLTGKAFAGGLAVELASSDASSVAVPATVTVSQGQPSASFSAAAASHPGCSIISTTYNTVKRNAALAVFPAPDAIFSLRESAQSSSLTVGVIFSTASTVARSLAVVSSNPTLAQVPKSIQVAAGSTSTNFTVGIQGTELGNCALIAVTDAKGNGNSFVVVNANGQITIIPGS